MHCIASGGHGQLAGKANSELLCHLSDYLIIQVLRLSDRLSDTSSSNIHYEVVR
jgi:hypothetical protein